MRGGFSARIVRAGSRGNVLNVGEQIGLVHVVAIELFEVEIEARGKRAADTRAGSDFMRRLFFLHPNFCKRVAIGTGGVHAWIIIDFIIAILGDRIEGGIGGVEVSRGRFEVEVAECVLAGAKFLLKLKAGDYFFDLRSGTGRVAERGLYGTILMRAWRVRENESVLIFGVLEEIVDSGMLEKARDEIEIGLAVLHAIFHRIVCASERIFVIGR